MEHFEKRRGGDGRQGDGRLHEPPDLRGSLQRDRSSCGPTGHDDDDERKDCVQDRDDRQRRRRPGLAAAHPQQGQAAGSWPTGSRTPKDPFRIVIVRDMWLTGFDAPCLHTMYVDKPMQGHGLMQAIARVNRVFRDKPGGLVVDYLGLADQLKQALGDLHRERRARATRAIDTAEAVAVMLEKYEICCDMLHGFDWSKWTTGKPGRAARTDSRRPRSTSSSRRTARSAGCRRSPTCPGPSPCVPPRRGDGDPRRHRLLPGRASGADQAEQPEPEDARADRLRRSASSCPRPSPPKAGDRRVLRRRDARSRTSPSCPTSSSPKCGG